MNEIKGTKGITLVALVVTIIVLLILAGVSIATLTGENGVLTKANTAKIETRGASVQEARDLWKVNQEVDKNTENATAQTLEELLNDLENHKLITSEERKTIEETGQITIGSRTIIFENIWKNVYDEDKNIVGVRKGNLTLKIGTIINYDATSVNTSKDANKLGLNNSAYTVTENKDENENLTSYNILYNSTMGYWQNGSSSVPDEIVSGNGYGIQKFNNSTTNNNKEVQWKVLGADEETGELLIISAKTLYSCATTPEVFYLRGYTGLANGIKELDNISKVYGYGNGASATTSARSVTVEDINKLIGYVPEYNSKYVIDWDGSNVRYILNGNTTGLLDISKGKGFNYFVMNLNNKIESWHSATSTNGVVMPNGIDADALIETHYYYNAKNYYEKDTENPEICDLIIDADSPGYWLASCHTRFYDTYFVFGLRLIDTDGGCWGTPLYYTNGWRS